MNKTKIDNRDEDTTLEILDIINNFMRPSVPIFIFILTFVFSCNSQNKTNKFGLSDRERYLCDSLKIDTTIVIKVRTQSDEILTPFPTNLEMVLDMELESDTSPNLSEGLIFHAPNSSSDYIVDKLYKDFQKIGYAIFVLEKNFDINNKPDVLGILKTTDKYQILKQVQTNGINWDIDNDSLLHLVKQFDEKYSLDLVGASGDWCEFKINKEPKNWLTLAEEAYKVCPDIGFRYS